MIETVKAADNKNLICNNPEKKSKTFKSLLPILIKEYILFNKIRKIITFFGAVIINKKIGAIFCHVKKTKANVGFSFLINTTPQK